MKYYLSLGSNLGNREDTLNRAITLIEERIGRVPKRSSFFYSEPWGFQSTNKFCNICVELHTEMMPIDLLTYTETIERELGRTYKNGPVYKDRPIDIDLLQAFLPNGDEIQMLSPRLTLPHPLMLQRDFVMIPLREIL